MPDPTPEKSAAERAEEEESVPGPIAEWLAAIDDAHMNAEAAPDAPIDALVDFLREGADIGETPTLALLDEIARLRLPVPCGHPAACVADGACGWCEDVGRLRARLAAADDALDGSFRLSQMTDADFDRLRAAVLGLAAPA